MFFSIRSLRTTMAAIAAVASVACSSNSNSVGGLPQSAPNGVPLHTILPSGAGAISHVVIIVQENRTVDNMFQGYPGANTVSSGKNSKGKTIQLQPVSLKTKYVIDHSAQAMFAACDGTGKMPGTHCRMDAFDQEYSYGGPPNPQYVYVPHNESKPYWDMAKEWVLGDNFHPSQVDESFVSHQYIIAGQAQSSVDVPLGPEWGCDGGTRAQVGTILKDRTFGPQQQACFDYPTLGDELDTAKLTWRFYTSPVSQPMGGFWSGYQAIKHIRYGPDWANVINPQKKFLSDVRKGTLSSVTWITPTCEESDHTACGGGLGPSWVTSLVNAVGNSKFWNSTAIFVFWDDWGGLYDQVPPPYAGYDGLGFRTPLLVISPYAKKNYISNVQYEHGSILRFTEDLFGLPQLSASDKRANSPALDCFDFKQKPRAFVPIKAPQDEQFFLTRAVDTRPPDFE
ncbi:MAG TPA: alkaline phosphatase family protein [Candidatus Tumulicola sp.]|jgi:phospholipase C